MELITSKVMIISSFLLVITMIETLAYSTRISGARVKLISLKIRINLLPCTNKSKNNQKKYM
jgi:Alternate to MurJ